MTLSQSDTTTTVSIDVGNALTGSSTQTGTSTYSMTDHETNTYFGTDSGTLVWSATDGGASGVGNLSYSASGDNRYNLIQPDRVVRAGNMLIITTD